AVAEGGGPPEGGRALAADDDRRSGALDGLGELDRSGEGDELAVVGGDLVRPQARHGPDVVVAAGAPPLEGDPEGGELLRRPAEADAEVDTPAGEVIEGHDLLGQDHRIALREDEGVGP